MPGDTDKALQSRRGQNVPLPRSGLCRPQGTWHPLCQGKGRRREIQSSPLSENVRQMRKMAGVPCNAMKTGGCGERVTSCTVAMDTENSMDQGFLS